LAARQQITVHYRRLEDVTAAFNGQTLEAAIRRAMGQVVDGNRVRDHWQRRAWVLPPGHDETLLMNVYHDGGNFFFGDLTQYTRGFLQALLAEMADVPMLTVEQEPPPEGKEYVHSMMYWLAVGNHMLMAQSRSLTGKQLEEYLTWLLKDRTAAIQPTGQVMLQAKFDAAEIGGDLEDISEIIVGGTATSVAYEEPEPGPPMEREVETYRSLGERRPWHERAFDVLRAVMNNEADVQELLNSIPEDADLEVAVHIGYRTRRRRVTRAPMQQALRNLPQGEITAIGKHGRITGKDIRLNYPARILKTGSLLDPDDVIRALREAYNYFVENGKIEP
jgi:hypothetical protein